MIVLSQVRIFVRHDYDESDFIQEKESVGQIGHIFF